MSRCLLCVHVWLENACERGVSVRLGSWSAVTMARTPFLVPVPCIACYRDQGNISCVGWAIVDRSWCLKRLAQVGGGAFFPVAWGVSWVVWQAASPTCILWFEWNHVVWGCKEGLRWCFEWALMSRCLLCVHVWLENACERGVSVRLGSWHPNLVVLRLSHPVKEFWNTVATQFFYG